MAHLSTDELALGLLERDARAARSDPEACEAALKAALAQAPWNHEVRMGAYRFYFYNHRYREALPHCEALIAHAARQLNLAGDWRAVRPGEARFAEADFATGLYLQTLIAWGYCHARLGAFDTAIEALAKCAELDPGDRFGAAAILVHVKARAEDDDEA